MRSLIAIILMSFIALSCSTSESVQLEHQKKETEFAKKEAELAKKELELSRTTPSPSEQPGETTPTVSKTTDLVEKISVRLIESDDNNHCIPVGGQKIFLAAKNETRYAGFPDKKGRVNFNVFRGLSCRQTVTIEAVTNSLDDASINIKLPCSKSVYLGTYDLTTRNKVTDKFADRCTK